MPRRAARPTASRSPTPAWTGTPPVGVLDGPGRRRARAPRGMRIAVLGVGPDRRLDRPGRARAARRRRGRRLRAARPSAWSERASWAPSTWPPARWRRRSTARMRASAARPVGALPDQIARRAGRRAGRSAWSPTWARSSAAIVAGDRRRALRGRPPDRRRRDGRGGARPRRPVRGRGLVPDAHASAPRACSTSACTGWSPRSAPRPAAIDADDPRPAAGRGQPPAARAGQRAGGPGGASRGELPADGPELPRRHARGGRQLRRSGPTSTWPTARRSPTEIDATVERLRDAAETLRAADAGARDRAGTTPPASDRRRLLEADLPERPRSRAAR